MTPRPTLSSNHAPAIPGRWTTRDLLRWTAGHLRERGVQEPRICAEMLLASVLGCDRMRLYMEVDRPASPEERGRMRDLVARAARHEPVQHLVGHAWFFSRRFDVDRSTLIPRPSTETVVEAALEWRRGRNGAPWRALDLGTGTGVIAVSLAVQAPEAQIVATDVIPAALELARRNAATHGVEGRIALRAGSLWEALASDERFDAIASNPPYISDAEWAQVAPNVREWEPESALRGGVDGLDLIRAIIVGAPARLAPGGVLLVEIAASQERAALALAAEAGFVEAAVLRDCDGLPRVLRAA